MRFIFFVFLLLEPFKRRDFIRFVLFFRENKQELVDFLPGCSLHRYGVKVNEGRMLIGMLALNAVE